MRAFKIQLVPCLRLNNTYRNADVVAAKSETKEIKTEVEIAEFRAGRFAQYFIKVLFSMAWRRKRVCLSLRWAVMITILKIFFYWGHRV